MVRPRLVEEGVPIVDQQQQNDYHNEDDTMNLDFPDAAAHHYHHYQPQKQQQHQHGTCSSSLQKAADSSSSSRKGRYTHHQNQKQGGFIDEKVVTKERSYHFEIGGQDENNKNDTMMMTEMTSSSNFIEHSDNHPFGRSSKPSLSIPASIMQPTARPTRIEIGADTRVLERMEGVQDHGYKSPMVVLDGANIAYAYSQALFGNSTNTKLIPNAVGIHIVCQYLERINIRIVVVLKRSYYNTNHQHSDWFQLIENYLLPKNMLLLAPSSDDDDAYCLSVAQIENKKQSIRPIEMGPGYAYIISNDLYRDAQARSTNNGTSCNLSRYLNCSVRTNMTMMNQLNNNTKDDGIIDEVYGPGRISYSFVDMGTMDDHGDKILDFVPNPSHPLIQWIESST